MASSFISEAMPYIILFLIMFIAGLFFVRRNRKVEQAYEKGIDELVEYLKSDYLSKESLDSKGDGEILRIALDKAEDSRKKYERLNEIFSWKTVSVLFMVMAALLIVAFIVRALSGSDMVFNLLLAIMSFFTFFFLIDTVAFFIIEGLKGTNEVRERVFRGALEYIEKADTEQEGMTKEEEKQRSAAEIRSELGSIIDRAKIRPWMGCLVTVVFIGIQLFLWSGSYPEPAEPTQNPYIIFAILMLVSMLDLIITPRIFYIGFISGYSNKGIQATKEIGIPGSSNPGNAVIIHFTSPGFVLNVCGFLYFFLFWNWPVSLLFHSIALLYVFRFQINLENFLDRMAENIASFPKESEKPLGLKKLIKITDKIFSRRRSGGMETPLIQ